jgi:putative transposase
MYPLQYNTSYHIFNHANGFENVFREAENYRFFLEKYRQYISPIAETYAWCLLPNHFHLVVRMRKREIIEKLILSPLNCPDSTDLNVNFSKVPNFGKVGQDGRVEKIDNKLIELYLSKQFARLFSCYTQSFNKLYKRMGSLFIKNFKREPIGDKQHFLNAIIYTHRNPIHHGFREKFDEWDYSSYPEILIGNSTTIETDKILKVFGGLESFCSLHQKNLDGFLLLDKPENKKS